MANQWCPFEEAIKTPLILKEDIESNYFAFVDSTEADFSQADSGYFGHSGLFSGQPQPMLGLWNLVGQFQKSVELII